MAKVNYLALNDTLKPINKNTVKAIERNSAKYIYVNRDRVAKCERCESEFTLANAKHRDTVKCPKCHRSFEVIHTWRKSGNESIHWEIVGSAATDTTFVIRYYLVVRKDGKIIDSNERARLFINTDKKEVCKMENSIWDNGWKKSGRHFFREFGMACYQTNRFFCMDGKVRRENILKELNKLSALKYCDIDKIWTSRYYAHSLHYIFCNLSLYEKLQKSNLENLIASDMNAYCKSDEIQYDRTQTELTKMLGINKNSLNLLKTTPTIKALKLIQDRPNINEREFMVYKDFSLYDLASIERNATKIKTSTYKLANYILKQGASYSEYSRYLSRIERLKYDITDKSYSMPKDISAENIRLDYEEELLRAEKYKEQDEKIKAIHERYTLMNDLSRFFDGSMKYMAYVPQSVTDLIKEGMEQHNCVGKSHFINAISSEETLVFFIREKDNPTASFVTMEYCNGAIVQCMLDHNERVDQNSEVYYFCSDLAKQLNKRELSVA